MRTSTFSKLLFLFLQITVVNVRVKMKLKLIVYYATVKGFIRFVRLMNIKSKMNLHIF